MSGLPESTPSWPVSAWSDGWFVVPHEVTWRDTDGMGHVNNAVYFTYPGFRAAISAGPAGHPGR